VTHLASSGQTGNLRHGLFLSVVVGGLSLAAIGRSMAGDAANTDRETARSQSDTKAVTTLDARAALPHATEVFAQAVAEASKIPKLNERTNELTRIAEAQAQAGQKKQARRTFGEAFAIARQHDQALPKDNREKDGTLRMIAEAQIAAGFLSDAMATGEKIGSPSELASLLDIVIPAQTKAGQLEAAIANTRKCKLNTPQHLCEIAVAQAKVGQKEQARKTFAEAVAIVKSYEEKDPKSDRIDVGACYADIASAEIRAELFEDAVAIANSRGAIGPLCEAGVALAKRGQTDRAIETFHAASAVAARNPVFRQDYLFLLIATAQADAKLTADAKKSFQQATAIAAKNDLNMHWQILLAVAREQAQVKMTADASATLQKVGELIKQSKLKTPQWWQSCGGESFARLAEAQLAIGMRKEATANFVAALAEAAELPDSLRWRRNPVRFTVVGKQWKAQLYADTLTTFQTIDVSDSPDTVEVVRVLQAWLLTEMGRFDEALAKSRQVSSEIHRAGCLFYVATKELDAGKPDSARQLVEEAITICRNADRHQQWINGAFGLGHEFNDKCFEQLKAFLITNSLPAMIKWVAVAYARAGHYSEVPAIVHALKTEDRQLDAWHESLDEISRMPIAPQHANEVAVMIAKAKADIGKTPHGKREAEMLACIATLEAQIGQAESARQTFSDALATAQAIRRHGDDSEEWLAVVVAAEAWSGFLAEAAESCRAMAESLQKDRFLKEIAEVQRGVALKVKVQEALNGQSVESSFANDPKFKSELAKSLAQTGRFSESIAIARQLSHGDQKAQVFSEIAAELKRVQDTKQLRAVVAEWTTIASQIEYLPSLERNLHEIVPYQAELGLGEEMRQSFDVRLNAAKKKESKYVVEYDSPNMHLRVEHGPPFREIAIDQAKYGSLVEACATIRVLKDVEQRSSAIREVLANCHEAKPMAEIRQVFAEALAVARECKKYKVDALLDLANAQAKCGLQKDANATLDELLALVRDSRELEILIVPEPNDQELQTRDTCKSIKNRVRSILQEALAVSAKLEIERDRGYVLGWIARQQAKAGFIAEAAETVRRIAPTLWRLDYAVPFAKMVRYAKGEQAATLPDEAFTEAVASSDRGSVRNQEIANVIRAAVRLGAFSKALEISQYWKDKKPGNRIAAMCFVAAAQCKTGQKEEAREVFAQASVEAFATNNDDFACVVVNEAKCGFLAEALADVRKIDHVGTRAAAFREIAVVLAHSEKDGQTK
jgi:tetratricopeptide (TPR) repeat protein